MGITQFSFDLLQRHKAVEHGIKMLELGDQNLYFGDHYGKFAKPLFESFGVDHTSIDIGSQKGGAIQLDLSKPINNYDWENNFDVITNFGTSEHVKDGLYQVFKTIHECCKAGGLMIHENPKTGNWPGHGHYYMTKEFYASLAKKMNYEIEEIGEHPAMGNTNNGWNIYCVLRRREYVSFISEKEFNKLGFKKS